MSAALTPAEVVGARIRSFRTMHVRTQAWLARKCLVSQMSVSRWERGECVPSRPQRALVASALGVDAGALFREVLDAEMAA